MPESERGPGGGYLFAGKEYKYDYGAIVARLGTAPDAQLAREIGCMRQQIRVLRERLGIPAYSILRRVRRILGLYPDAQIGRAFGVAPGTISVLRRKLGIPPADRKAVHARQQMQAYLEALED